MTKPIPFPPDPEPDIKEAKSSQAEAPPQAATPQPPIGAHDVRTVSRDLLARMDPGAVAAPGALSLPWSAERKAHAAARDASLAARLDIFKDDLRAIRMANEVLTRAATMRAVEAAEAAIFEIRTLGEIIRLSLVNRAHLEMTREFTRQLERLEEFRGQLPVELLDALKERALDEFTNRMARASKADLEFGREQLVRWNPGVDDETSR
ncbi:MAG: hypothetical protein R2762_06655 [Bryobacteraceae bacterium]